MYAPITGSFNVPMPELPLQGVSQQLAFSMPSWFNTDPETGLMGKALAAFGTSINPASESISNLIDSVVPGNGDVTVPRLAFIASIPSSFAGNDVSNNNPVIQGYFRASSGSAWTPMYQADNVSELFLSEGPVFYTSNQQALIRNVERNLVSATGSYVSGSASGYKYILPPLTEDVAILTSVNPLLPSEYWMRHEPNTQVPREIILSVSGSYVWYSSWSESRNFDILWTSSAGSGYVTASPVQLANHWDRQASYVGLLRQTNESNTRLKNRIRASFQQDTGPHRQAVLFRLALSLNLVDFYSWDGYSPTNIGSDYSLVLISNASNIKQIDWTSEFLKEGYDEIGRYFTSSKKTVITPSFLLDGRFTFPETMDDGVIRFSPEQDYLETPHQAQIETTYYNWSLSGNMLLSTGNLPRDNYHVAVIRSIDINSLESKHLRNRLFDATTPTVFARSILSYQRKRSSVSYGNGRWGATRFIQRVDIAPHPTTIPYAFED